MSQQLVEASTEILGESLTELMQVHKRLLIGQLTDNGQAGQVLYSEIVRATERQAKLMLTNMHLKRLLHC